MDFLKGGLWPISDYPNYLGLTPADMRPNLKGLLTDTYILDQAPIEYNVDWGDPFGEKTVYIKTPIYEEEKKMIIIPGMNERETRALVDGLNEICYDVSVKREDAGFGAVKSILKLELPVEKARYLKVAGQAIAKQSSKSGWIEGIPAVKKVETYNQRVVKVTFIDDTSTKSVCSKNDHFDIDVGITICLLKRILGTNGDDATRNYNKLMNQVHDVMKKNDKEKAVGELRKIVEKNKKRKAELKRAAKKLKAKEEQIDIQKQAIIRAHQEMEGLEQ